ncbi:MAG: acetyl-CoA carboxylase biotin carboxyl carrier protein subunit [Butyricicoccus sp.]|nr:acetyl-CoA carboxylase biotin carboxyl carrier protein subunit [Butyricicoccus sp.]
MELSDILTLFDRFDAGTASELKLELGDSKLTLRRTVEPAAPVQQKPSVPAPAAAIQPAPGKTINAPLVGTFYAAPSPEAAPFAAVGTTIRKGAPVCLIEAMKMLSEVPAPCDCVIEEVLVENGAAVAFDAPLFRIREL